MKVMSFSGKAAAMLGNENTKGLAATANIFWPNKRRE
jgi:hypothetical protein